MFAALFLLVVVVVFRVVVGISGSADFHGLHNFAPLAAIALCGAVYLPRRLAVALPLLMLLLSDLALNAFYHQPFFTADILPHYFALALISLLGLALRSRASAGVLLTASVLGSVAFYVITNTGSWIHEPGYAKTFSGWLQALTRGLPGYPPTWWFYRNTLISDVLFTALFLATERLAARKAKAAQPVAA